MAELLPRARIIVLTATEDVVLRRDNMRSKHTAATELTAEQTTTPVLRHLEPATTRDWNVP